MSTFAPSIPRILVLGPICAVLNGYWKLRSKMYDYELIFYFDSNELTSELDKKLHHQNNNYEERMWG